MKTKLKQSVIWLCSRTWPAIASAAIMYPCITLFLSTLAGVASGPAAHPASAHLAPLTDRSHDNSLHTEQLAPPSGTARFIVEVSQ